MLKQTLTAIQNNIQRLPRRYVLIFAAVAVVGGALAGLYWPRSIDYAYQKRACIGYFTLAPDLFRGKSQGFELSPGNVASIAGVNLYATELCVQPVAPPSEGKLAASWSLGGVVPARSLSIKTTGAPTASVKVLDKPIPVSKPLSLSMSGSDEIFGYALHLGDKRADCITRSEHLNCQVEKVGLDQGATYDAQLVRYFNTTRVNTIAKTSVKTLTAISVKESSIKTGEKVFAKPRELRLVFDKVVKDAAVELARVDDGKANLLETKTQFSGGEAVISWDKDLDRQASYRLVVDKVQAGDGSTLVEPYKLNFEVSGGPRVKSISVGTSGVAVGSTAVITFDQTLSKTQEAGRGVSVTGGATVLKRQGNQLLVSLVGVPRCGQVGLAINDELASEYEVVGGSSWSYSTRTLCQAVSSIGQSSGGRPITAYSFGSGPTNVLYTGAIHGNETSTRSLMLRWIDEIESKPDKVPADKTVIIIPSLNPDGVVAGTRVNARNVDLNRNFATADWRKDITTVTNAPFPGGGGSTAMSEPETQALAAYVARLQPKLVLSYHSIGGLLAANQAGVSSSYARTYSSLSGYSNTTGSSSTFEYAVSGTADDYYAEKLGVASILIELGSHTHHQFERNQKAMWAMLN